MPTAETTSFAGVELLTSSRVMTPRPTSVPLLDRAVEHLAGGAGVVVDVGTGSGALAIAIATAAPRATVLATDLSLPAVELATANVARAGLADRVVVRRGYLLEPLDGRADVIVANLPYLPLAERSRYPELWGEPQEAVFSAGDGLCLVRRLVAAAGDRLAPTGLLALQLPDRIVSAPRAELRSLAASLEPAALAAA